jgi:hypothetical protein
MTIITAMTIIITATDPAMGEESGKKKTAPKGRRNFNRCCW